MRLMAQMSMARWGGRGITIMILSYAGPEPEPAMDTVGPP